MVLVGTFFFLVVFNKSLLQIEFPEKNDFHLIKYETLVTKLFINFGSQHQDLLKNCCLLVKI